MIFGRNYFGQHHSGESIATPVPTHRTRTSGASGKRRARGVLGRTLAVGASGRRRTHA